MGRLPSVGRGPSIKRPESPIGNMIGGMLPPTDDRSKRPPFGRGSIGNMIGGMLPPTPVGGLIGGAIGGMRPHVEPVRPPYNKPPIGIGGDQSLRDYMENTPDFFRPTRPDRRVKPPRDSVGGGRNIPINDGVYRGGTPGFYGPERPDLADIKKEDLVGGGSRVRPVQDRRTRDFNPNLESFDAKQYLSNYGDLQKAFGTDEAKARQHFIDYGIKEGRVDTAGGGTLKGDIRDRRSKTFKAKRMAAAAKRREGFVRGEEGATFDAKQYLANYKDLQDAFGTDEEKARQHYKQYGAKEGRVDTRM